VRSFYFLVFAWPRKTPRYPSFSYSPTVYLSNLFSEMQVLRVLTRTSHLYSPFLFFPPFPISFFLLKDFPEFSRDLFPHFQCPPLFSFRLSAFIGKTCRSHRCFGFCSYVAGLPLVPGGKLKPSIPRTFFFLCPNTPTFLFVLVE